MTMSACFIIGAGPFFGLPVPPAPGDYIIAADGGYRHCQEAGLVPDLLLGDFDSLTDLPPAAEIRRFPVDKDDTDSMLAIKLGLDMGFRTFHLYGGTGGRPDHTLANLQGLAYLAERGAKGWLYDKNFVFTALWNDGLDLPARQSGVFSVFALGATARGVTISGGRYALEDGDLSPYFPLGVSNHFEGRPVHISVREGCLLAGWELPLD